MSLSKEPDENASVRRVHASELRSYSDVSRPGGLKFGKHRVIALGEFAVAPTKEIFEKYFGVLPPAHFFKALGQGFLVLVNHMADKGLDELGSRTEVMCE